MEKNLQKWADSHLPNKTTDDLWDLQAAILTELSRRDDVQYQVRASKGSLDNKFKQLRIGTTLMPVKTKSGAWGSSEFIEATPKKSRQGRGKHSKYSATSRNGPRKRYR